MKEERIKEERRKEERRMPGLGNNAQNLEKSFGFFMLQWPWGAIGSQAWGKYFKARGFFHASVGLGCHWDPSLGVEGGGKMHFHWEQCLGSKMVGPQNPRNLEKKSLGFFMLLWAWGGGCF